MVHSITDLTLDEVIAVLIAGEALRISEGPQFSLPLTDSRAILSFYNRDRRAYWNPDKDTAIQDGEVDKVLAALDAVPKTTAPAPRQSWPGQKWQLTKVIAHRFRGLHRHCTHGGSDPKLFELDLSAGCTLLRGFNGAGKTSLIGAICWCLTGMGPRSGGLPAALHDPVPVRAAESGSGDGATPGASFELPAIVPIPTEDELVAVGGAPKSDTWVRLTFRSLIDGREVQVERQLQRDGKRAFKTVTVGLDKLGLSDLALQVGTLMPGIAAATRFDDKTTLSQAVSTLTGLRPLAHFGKRSARLYDRLCDKYSKQAREEKEELEASAARQLTTLNDLLKDGGGLLDPECLVLPVDATPDAWEQGLAKFRAQLIDVEEQAAKDARLVLGALPALNAESDVTRFGEDLTAVEHCFSSAALRGLPSMRLATSLGELREEDLAQAEEVLDKLKGEAEALALRLADIARANRLRLYGIVAKWHEEAHPGCAFTSCPVCGRDLTKPGAAPRDTVLDQSVAEALEHARTADAASLKTAAEWERDTMRALRGRLPACLATMLAEDVPDDLATVYKNALSNEVFAQVDFPATFREKISRSVADLCERAWKEAPARPLVPSAALPPAIPDNEKLRDAIEKVRRTIMLARYLHANAAFAKTAVAAVLRSSKPETGIPAHQRSVAGQIAVLNNYREAACLFAGIQRQLDQIGQTRKRWKEKCIRLERLDRAAKAVEPFMQFPDLVHNQVAGLISSLETQTKAWAERMYKPQFLQAPAYAGLDRQGGDGLRFLATQGGHLVEAHHVMNASALRSYLFAFVLALWQQVWNRSGGISTILMDDPQDLLDPGNTANLAATVPEMITAGMNPIVASNDFGFIPAIQSFVSARAADSASRQVEIWEFSAISTSKCTVGLSPVADEARSRCDHWQKKDPNDVALARAFVHPVRTRIEAKLWDLLASDPAVLSDPTLNDLLGKIANARKRGERPFNEEPFRRLLGLAPLRPDAPFRDVINKAHHGKADQITPSDAEMVREGYDEVFAAIDACWLAYARFMGRLPPEQAVAEVMERPANPVVIPFQAKPIPVIGRLAARELGSRFSTIEEASETLDLSALGNVSLFTLRAPTLGLVALPGQTLLVSVGAAIKNGDLAIVQTAEKTYARRIGIDPADTARIALESIPSSSARVPPTYFAPRNSVTINKIIGVLFDDNSPVKSIHEAIPIPKSAIFDEVLAAATVVGDSAFPVALDKGHVLLSKAQEAQNVAALAGQIIAVVTHEGEFLTDAFAYLKRLGKRMPGNSSVYYLENVGPSGAGEFVQFPRSGPPVPEIPIVQSHYRVLGTILG